MVKNCTALKTGIELDFKKSRHKEYAVLTLQNKE